MPAGTKETTLIKDAIKPVAQTQQALEKGDVAAARKAWNSYDPIWNGMEVYVSHRSRPNYEDLELNWQAKITKALEDPGAKAADVLPMTKAMLATWDKALKLAEDGPKISPFFDDVATIRKARQPLRKALAALSKGDADTARGAWGDFARMTWPQTQRLYRERAPQAYEEVENAVKAATPVFFKKDVTVKELTDTITNVNTKFGAGQTQVTQAARNDKV